MVLFLSHLSLSQHVRCHLILKLSRELSCLLTLCVGTYPFSSCHALRASERQHVHHLVKVLNILSQLKHDGSSELSLKISIWEEIWLNRNLSLNYKPKTTRHVHRGSILAKWEIYCLSVWNMEDYMGLKKCLITNYYF